MPNSTLICCASAAVGLQRSIHAGAFSVSAPGALAVCLPSEPRVIIISSGNIPGWILGNAPRLSRVRLNVLAVRKPLHGSKFDIATGRALTLPAFLPEPVYDVEVADASCTSLRRPRNSTA